MECPSATDSVKRLRLVDQVTALAGGPGSFADAVVAAAAAVAGTPISSVTIVGKNSVHVRASRGLAIGTASRGDSFCAQALLCADHFVIEDARKDERFCDNPFVHGAPFIRFYAGFTLVVSGQPVGVLCVIDDRPRTLSLEQIQRLATLAQGTAAWLSLELDRVNFGAAS